MRVSMKNPKTGELKEVKVGWSWILFLFSGVFGLPLFLRKLNVWGFVFLAMWAVYYLTPETLQQKTGVGLDIMWFLVEISLSIWLGIKGNEMTAKNYLDLGWIFAHPDSDSVRFACGKWGISVPQN